MEVDSGFHSLLGNLKIDGPLTSPKTWESIGSESGNATPIDPVQGRQETIYYLSSVSESILVRLVINALQGVRSAITEIDSLSCSFCSSPADRSFHRVPNLWCRLSSTYALGRMLKSISHSGLLFYSLREFVKYFLSTDLKFSSVKGDKNANCPIPSNCAQDKNDRKEFPPYSLVNQAFSVAVGKLLEGYVCSFNTLESSIKLRRSEQCRGDSVPTNNREDILTSVIHSEMTVMEVYLHTKELRSQIEALGSICFCQPFYQTLPSDVLSLNSTMEFHNFPRGADLLSYLYVKFRDADQVHHSLLKYLFVRSFEPYSTFIKSWIYRATIDDPYGEFFVSLSVTTPTMGADSCSFGKACLASIKSGVSIPSFLKDVCHPLLLAGQQLQLLVKLLDFYDLSFSGNYAPCDFSILTELLPFWVDPSSKLISSSDPLIFDIDGIEALIQKRDIMYRTMLEKLQNYLVKFSEKVQQVSDNVITFGSMPNMLVEKDGMNSMFPSMLDDEANFKHGNINGASDNADSDSSYSSIESADESEQSLSAECLTDGYSNVSIDECLYDLRSNLCHPEKSVVPDSAPAHHVEDRLLQTNTKNVCPYFHPASFHTFEPFTSSRHHIQTKKLEQMSSFSNSEAIKNSRTSKNLTETCESGGCWPLGGLQSNPFCAYMTCREPQKLQFSEYCFQNLDGNSGKFSSEVSFSKAFSMLSFDGSGRTQNSSWTFKSLYCHSSAINLPYALSMNPMLTKTEWLPTVCKSSEINLNNNKASYFPNFNFSSVTDPCKLLSESLPLDPSYRSEAATSISVQRGGSVENLVYSGGPIKASMEVQPISASLCYSARETYSQGSDQLPDTSGGADWTRLLTYPVKSDTYIVRDIQAEDKFVVPLDIVLDKCILQKILLQYEYISRFTIKFLEEGFNIREHLMALKRYHFMEISDWADLFVMSLSSQLALDQDSARIQAVLDLALQRSSSEKDPYKERLFICTKEQANSQPAFGIDIHAFDFIVLGYRVDWPVNVVVSKGALQIYANIFNFLLQIRLAVISLTEVWHYLKDLLHCLKDDPHKTFNLMEDFNILMRMRQHVNHFATTLQQYVQSQLSDVLWFRFQGSLKYMVECMLDLESAHMMYLADAMHICFLSDDAKEVSAIIKNILQCALDFRTCFTGIGSADGVCEKDLSFLRSQIKFSQVFNINNTFEKNIKELHLWYLKGPTHAEFGLRRLWTNLNFNGYFSGIINRDLGDSFVMWES